MPFGKSEARCRVPAAQQGLLKSSAREARRYWWDGAHAAVTPVSDPASASSLRLILINRLGKRLSLLERRYKGRHIMVGKHLARPEHDPVPVKSGIARRRSGGKK